MSLNSFILDSFTHIFGLFCVELINIQSDTVLSVDIATSNYDGSFYWNNNDCEEWTHENNYYGGNRGSSSSQSSGWTYSGGWDPCNMTRAIYCFEQPPEP